MCKKWNYFRVLKAEAQDWRCYYCDQPMFCGDAGGFARAYGVTRPKAESFRCTAEHLRARMDGGQDTADNIVAACLFCNRTRHRSKTPLDPEAYREKVRKRMSAGRWNRLPEKKPGARPGFSEVPRGTGG